MSNITTWMSTMDEIDALIPKCANTLGQFYQSMLGFRSSPTKGDVSIISHAACVEAMREMPFVCDVDCMCARNYKDVVGIFLNNPWSTGDEKEDSSYPVSFTIPALTKMRECFAGDPGEAVKKVSSGVDVLAKVIMDDLGKATEGFPVREEKPLRHALFLYRIRRALAYVQESWLPDLAKLHAQQEKDYMASVITPAVDKLEDYLKSQLYYYLSMCAAIPDSEDDAIQLGYLLYALFSYASYKNDVILEYGARLVIKTLFAENRVPRPRTIYQNKRLIISAWPIELLRLLSQLRPIRAQFHELAEYYQRAFLWLRRTERFRLFENDPDVPGWMAEPWRGKGEPEAWLNAAAIRFLIAYRDLLRDACASEIKVDLGATTTRPEHVWEDLIDYDGYKTEVETDFIKPIRERENGSALPIASIVLFGPPGASKTSIARALAWKLEWPFVELLPHHFAEDGLDAVIRKVREVFRKLMILKECVVFFDEVDELVRGRDEEHEKIGRLITTSVLPWLQELRRRAQLVFIVATNNIRNFDPAVKRPGRFDLVLPVGPPEVESRNRTLSKMLEAKKVPAAMVPMLVNTASESIDKVTLDLEEDEKKVLREKYRNMTEKIDATSATPWPITIGELNQISKLISGSVSKGLITEEVSAKIRVAEHVNRLSQNPLVSSTDFMQFSFDKAQYRQPPKSVAV